MVLMARRSAVLVSGGLAAVAGGALWGVKSLNILLTGDQPPLVFELAPLLFGLAVTALAAVDRRHASRARWALALGCVAVVAGSAAALSDLAGELWGPAIAVAMIAVLVGLILLGSASRSPIGSVEWVALAIGLVTVPALLVGGALSLIDERLLEVPLVLLAGMWIWLGGLMIRERDAS